MYMLCTVYSQREFDRQTFQGYGQLNLGGLSFTDNFYNKKHITLTIILINLKLEPVVSSTNKLICQTNPSIDSLGC